MKNNLLKLLSVVLSIVLIVMSLPLSAFSAAPSYKDDSLSEIVENNADVVELTDMRTATAKYFRLDDGSYYVAQYDTDIHFLDDRGVWQDIDNTLSISGNEITTSNAKIKFAKKTNGSNNIFTMHDDNRKISFALDGAVKKVSGEITNNEQTSDENITRLQKMTELSKISASVIYEDILPNTDLEYIINGLNIKENIIVKEKADNYSYSFTMELNNLFAVLNENGEIIVSDPTTNEIVYVIPAPIMWDSINVVSENVTMSLTEIGNGKYTLTITADTEWMNSDDRVYPITIDPPIYTSSSSSVTDLTISTSTSTSTSTILYTSDTYKSYWKLTILPTLPASAYITNAEFTLDGYIESEMSGYVAVYDVLTDWDSTLTWSDTTNSSNPEGKAATDFTDYQYVECYEEDLSFQLNKIDFTWNVTPIVKKWYAGENYGLMLTAATDTTFNGRACFTSNNYSNASYRPQLCIQYQDMKGLEDHWNYTSQSAGFAGTGSVNVASGNLVFSIPTLTSTDALMPFTPNLVYNSALAAKDYSYSNAQTAYTTAYAAKGFKLNISETLIKKSYSNEVGTKAYMFVFADSDGTEHYFMPTKTTRTYKDEDGLLLTLVEGTSECTITDSGENVRRFKKCSSSPSGTTSAWCLESITDKNGNKITFNIDESYRPTTVTLTPNGHGVSIEQLKIAYTTDGDIFAIWNPASGEGVILRYSEDANGNITTNTENYLRQVVRAHGGTTETQWKTFYNTNANASTSVITVDAVSDYTYNSSGLLLSVTNNLSQYRISYTYDSSNRVTSVKEYAVTSSTSLGQQLSLEYGTSNTIVRTSGKDDSFGTTDDLITTYVFDYNGRAVSCYTTDLNKTQVYGVSGGQYVGSDNENAKNNLKSSVQTTQQSSNFILNGGFETTSTSSIPYWTKSGTAVINGISAYAGKNAAALTVTSSSTTSQIYQYVYLDKGEYSLSMNIDTVQSQGVKVYLKAESMTNSAHSVTKEIPVNQYYATGGYAFASLDFSSIPTTTTGTERFKISVTVTGSPTSSETVYVDNIMLSRTTGAAQYDMVQAGHFETSNASYSPSNFWTATGDSTASITIVDSGSVIFGSVLKIDKPLGSVNIAEQVVYQATADMRSQYDDVGGVSSVPELYTLSGWGKGTAQNYASSSFFSIGVEISYYKNGSYTAISEYLDFDKGITDWQFVSGGFASDPNYGMIDKITIILMYNDHSGIGYFDSISLVKDSSTTEIYDYNANGYMTTYQKGGKIGWYQYDENDNLTGAISSDKSIVDYEYDSNNRVIKETYSRYTGTFSVSTGEVSGTVTERYFKEYGYNAYGQLSSEYTCNSINSSEQALTYTEYNTSATSHIFGTVAAEYDELYNATQYFYNESTGRLLATVYPEGNGVSYTYDAIGNLVSVLPANINSSGTGYITNNNSASVTYDYDDATNRLTSITTKPTSSTSTVYYFTYDNFGNTTGVSVGSRSLASYTYNSYNGKLDTLTYGNGLKVKYVYDILDRIAEIQYNTGSSGAYETVYSYTYDTAGNLYSVTDHSSNEVTMYKYDAEGKLMESYVYDMSTYLNLYGTAVYYDEQSRVSMVFHNFDYAYSSGVTDESTYYLYSYDDSTGFLESLDISGDYLSGTITPTYDVFGRAKQKIIDFNVNSADAFYNKLTFDYMTDDLGYESGLVSQVVSSIGKSSGTSTTTYNYTYDANGNITQISNASGVIQNKYYYDDLGQLIREDNRAKGYSYVYTYDNAGNITAKIRYAFTTGTLGTAQSTTNYTYGNSTWRDLLTKYGSTTISYDTIGNPTSYGDYSLTWQGRELQSVYDGSLYTTSFGYNADGIRTYKDVYDSFEGMTTRHEYTLNGSQIVKETVYLDGTEQYTIAYIYDEVGSPIGMKYRTPSYANGVFDCYFFEKNLQGDIIAVYNSNGTKIITYTYDAWGATTVTYNGGTAAQKAVVSYNPFRYRGYYFDTETGYYYLQSRYYNPNWGRFLNADAYINANGDIVGHNMFAYCSNNPIKYKDFSGSVAIIDDAIIFGISVFALLVICFLVPPMYEATDAAVKEAYFGVSKSIDNITDIVEQEIDSLNEKHPGEYTVYALKDAEGYIRYVGRTKNLNARLAAHRNSKKTGDLTLAFYYSGLTWTQARGLEQVGIVSYNTINEGVNSIPGISQKNPNRIPYLTSAWDYIYNQISNEFYNAIGR